MKIYYRLNRALVLFFTTFVNKIVMSCSHISYGKRFRSCGFIFIRNYAGKDGITIGNDVNINSCGMANPVGGDGKTYLFASKNGKIVIGDMTGISNCVIFSSDNIDIGREVTIGAGTKIYDTDFHSIKADYRLNGNSNVPTAPVKIGNRVFIGGGVTILKGVEIGDEAVIGAGSVVTHDVPAREVWAGNPIRFIKKL